MKKLFLYVGLLIISQPVLAHRIAICIDTTMKVSINGLQQVINIKGNDSDKPLLLYLHGAAGNKYSLIANSDKLTSKLQEHFIVVLWDQRDYGKTFELNRSTKPLTVQLIDSDATAMVNFLLNKFSRKKLYIAAHSMGCVMAMHIALHYPECLYALVMMSPPVDGIASQRIGLETLKKHFQQLNNQRAIKELAAVRLPARDFESLFIKYVWQTEYDGEHITDSTRAIIKPLLKKWMESPASALSNEVFEMNFFRQYPAVRCPVYFFIGRKDMMTNAAISARYYQKIKAPKKQLFWFEKSAHGIPDTEADKMQDLIVNKILSPKGNKINKHYYTIDLKKPNKPS